MSISHVLQPLYPHTADAKEITESEFGELRDAVRGAFACLGIEEKFGYVLSNLRELELSMLETSFDAMTTANYDWSEGITTIHNISVRLLNLLSTCRLYLDQSSATFKRLFGRKSTQLAALKLATDTERNAYASYRIMEALRNHCQHCDVPVYGITQGGGWDGPHLEHLCILKLDRVALLADKGIQDPVRADIGALDEQFDVRPIVREYVESLARIHETVQSEMSAFGKSCEEAVESCLSQFGAGEGKRQIVHAEKRDGRKRLERFTVFSAPVVRREELSHERRFTKYIARHFVSNRLTPSAEVDRTTGSAASA